MRFFFSSGTAGKARHSVKDRIKRIIEAEDKNNPLSDDVIAEKLSQGRRQYLPAHGRQVPWRDEHPRRERAEEEVNEEG